MKAIAISFSLALLVGTTFVPVSYAQSNEDLLTLPPLPGADAPAEEPVEDVIFENNEMDFPPLTGSTEADASVEIDADAQIIAPDLPAIDVEPSGEMEIDAETNVDEEADAEVLTSPSPVPPAPPAVPSTPSTPPAPPVPPAPTTNVDDATVDQPEPNDDYFGNLFKDDDSTVSPVENDDAPTVDIIISDEIEEDDAMEQQAAPRSIKPIVPDLQRLPAKIYKKTYDTDNRHLPKADYEYEYDEQLFVAAAHDRVEVIRGFMDREGRNVSMRNEVGDTVLLYAVRNGAQNSVRMLLGRGADANAVNFAGVSALQYALLTERADIAEALLEKGADPNLADYEGVTPLMIAATKANPIFVQQLIARGAAPNTALRSGRTAMHLAAHKNNARSIAALIEGGGSVYAVDAKGYTPLMIAARAGANNASSVLLKAGADAGTRDNMGRTAIDFARQNGNQAMVSQMMAHDLHQQQPWLENWQGSADVSQPVHPSSM